MSEQPILRISKGDGEEDYVPLSQAIEKLSGYYDLSAEEIENCLRHHMTMQTISYYYRIER